MKKIIGWIKLCYHRLATVFTVGCKYYSAIVKLDLQTTMTVWNDDASLQNYLDKPMENVYSFA